MNMTKAKVMAVRADVDKAIEKALAKHGLVGSLKNLTYSSDSITIQKFTISAKGSGPVDKFAKEASDFKRYAKLYNMSESDLGAKVEISGKIYTIVGAKPRATRYPIIVENNGKYYKMDDAVVARAL
jgi:hypothetical protein